jgi:replicative DNA helicase
VTGVTSGFQTIDNETGGWQPSDLVIVAARPGMGKTAWALSGATRAAKQGVRVLVFSLEMSASQLVQRIVSFEARIDNRRLRDGRITESDEKALLAHAEALALLPLYIDDTPAISVNDLRARARRHAMQHGLDVIYIDYLQLMTANRDERSRSGNREQEIASISRGLKSIAKELNVPVIALSQLSRNVEGRASKRPQLSDIRESGAIENDADIVGFIFRPEYYDEDDPTLHGVAEFDIAKHRNGRTGVLPMRYEKEFTLFTDEKKSHQFPATINTARQEPETPF